MINNIKITKKDVEEKKTTREEIKKQFKANQKKIDNKKTSKEERKTLIKANQDLLIQLNNIK